MNPEVPVLNNDEDSGGGRRDEHGLWRGRSLTYFNITAAIIKLRRCIPNFSITTSRLICLLSVFLNPSSPISTSFDLDLSRFVKFVKSREFLWVGFGVRCMVLAKFQVIKGLKYIRTIIAQKNQSAGLAIELRILMVVWVIPFTRIPNGISSCARVEDRRRMSNSALRHEIREGDCPGGETFVHPFIEEMTCGANFFAASVSAVFQRFEGGAETRRYDIVGSTAFVLSMSVNHLAKQHQMPLISFTASAVYNLKGDQLVEIFLGWPNGVYSCAVSN
ncbi:hypothetical protein R3P38DRAFT_2802196 [Favolaschia claudopus]|uniref:Uncharacterized protein n=1 Tax=Favolaschia claudopus TaxID=2862362 RepID=A0AAV9ZV36_9AGAR